MKFYITTAIDYVNAKPHIGHALEKIQADVLARYHRQKGESVFFLTGTDEHGAKILRAAEEAGKSPDAFTDEMSESFRALKEALNLSWDYFIRTTDKNLHLPAVHKMWKALESSGDIYKKKYSGLYCVGHEAFITKKDLVDGKCADHGREPEKIEEENYFFKLSKYSQEIESRIKNQELRIIPKSRENEILSLINSEGLEDVSFSRPSKDLPWGIPVPGDESQTIYVWCDALTNYISAVGYGTFDRNGLPQKNAERFFAQWPADVQVIGKDILRFHAAIWPGMLLSAGLPLPKKIFAHGFLTVNGKKMSKTVGNVLDPISLVKKYGADSLRYYLLREIPSGGDGDFSEAKFKERYNSDLANGLGNFTARVLTLASDAGVLRYANDINDSRGIDADVDQKIKKIKAVVCEKIEEFKLNDALANIWELISFGDNYVNEKKPWKKVSKDREKTIFNLIVILDNISSMIQPFLPGTSEKITNCIRWDDNILRVKNSEALFPRISD